MKITEDTLDKIPRYGLKIDDEYYGFLNLSAVLEIISIQLTENLEETDICDISVKRLDMTYKEFANLPEE